MRILGDITEEKIRLVQAADRILDEELRLAELYNSVWQAFPVLLPVSTVGVMGDERTYERVVAIRAVTSVDGMTADWATSTRSAGASFSTNRFLAELTELSTTLARNHLQLLNGNKSTLNLVLSALF